MSSTSESAGASRADESGFATLTVPNRVESIREAMAFVVGSAAAMAGPAASGALFEVAVNEALTNAFRHGNTAARDDTTIVCEVERAGRCLTVRVFDQGHGFELPVAEPPRPEWHVEDATAIPERGFGLPIIRSVFPAVRTITRPGQFGIEMALPL